MHPISSSSSPRSPRRSHYNVPIPSNHDVVEQMPYGSRSPVVFPPHHFHHASPIHHSLQSSISLENPCDFDAWNKIQKKERDGPKKKWIRMIRHVFFWIVWAILVDVVFSLIFLGASRSFEPEIIVKNMVFEKYSVELGPLNLMLLNSTVRILFRNPAPFFGLHVRSSLLELWYIQTPMATGQIKEFYQPKNSEREYETIVCGKSPTFGDISILGNSSNPRYDQVEVPLNLTVTIKSGTGTHIFGKLVDSTFSSKFKCPVVLRMKNLGKALEFNRTCTSIKDD